MNIPNIYESKHYKRFILIPLVLMFISAYLILGSWGYVPTVAGTPKIQLDSSLRGGVTVQLQTNSSLNDTRNITTKLDQLIPNSQASVSRSPGGISIAMVANQSLSNAQSYVLDIYSAYSNYSADTVNITEAQSALTTSPSNSTYLAILASSKKGQNQSVTQMNYYFNLESSALIPFLNGKTLTYNTSGGYQALVNSAQDAYSNASQEYEASIISKIRSVVPFTSYSYDEVTPTLGAFFLSQMRDIIIVSFILVAIAVFFIFRSPAPSFAVVFGAANDIIVALGAMAIFGIPLGLASLGGLLMLLGYSIDTDMLSGVRVLKRHDSTPEGRAFSSFKTGITMTLTAIISFSILLIVSYIAFIPTYYEISAVVLVGLVADLLTTWLGNMPIILWYKKNKDGHR